jgi:hypothetical protein
MMFNGSQWVKISIDASPRTDVRDRKKIAHLVQKLPLVWPSSCPHWDSNLNFSMHLSEKAGKSQYSIVKTNSKRFASCKNHIIQILAAIGIAKIISRLSITWIFIFQGVYKVYEVFFPKNFEFFIPQNPKSAQIPNSKFFNNIFLISNEQNHQ